MHRTLYGKLAIALIALLGTIGIFYGVLNLYTTKVFLQELNQRFNRDLARQLLVQRNLGAGDTLDEGQIKAIFGYYMHINPAIEIYLLDPAGNILAFEAPQMKIKRRRVDMGPVRRFIAGDTHYPILGDDPRDPTREKVFSAAAYPPQGPPSRYLYVVLSGEDYANVAALLGDSYFARLSIAGVAASVLIGVLGGLYLFNLLTRRLRRLAGAMEGFRASDFRYYEPYAERGDTPPRDEIDTLGQTFDAMAARIREQVEALAEKDSLRRNLVANVSHDLRTPLASLRGYLERLMLKSAEMDEGQRQEHLAVAFRQSERLSQLVGELFDLAKLDARESQPEFEPLAIGELLHDVAQKYRLQAESRSIALSVALPPEPPLVRADIAMINRVLENLTANALEHTPEGGQIGLNLVQDGGRVTIEVANSGAGVPTEQIPHLFERFYQAPEQRGGGGAGLGLAIVNRIVELHGAEIRVESEPGGKTAFRFDLPLWVKS